MAPAFRKGNFCKKITKDKKNFFAFAKFSPSDPGNAVKACRNRLGRSQMGRHWWTPFPIGGTLRPNGPKASRCLSPYVAVRELSPNERGVMQKI
jgi:hypothetical protein